MCSKNLINKKYYAYFPIFHEFLSPFERAGWISKCRYHVLCVGSYPTTTASCHKPTVKRKESVISPLPNDAM